ncbi:MAG: peptidylprolyl isomerase [Bacteroidota bacterium]
MKKWKKILRFSAPILAVGGMVLMTGCGASKPVVATVGNEKITLDEFEQSYSKNNGGWDAGVQSKPEDRQRYLDLLLKFRLKVQEAHAQGLLRDSSVQNELETYRVSVAQAYMVEKELIAPMVQKMYDHKQEELRARQILIRVARDASPADTLTAYNRAMKVVSLLPKIQFDTLASAYSEDPTATFNKGDIGFFNTGRLAPEVEDACYALKPGEYTKTPVRSSVGYHVIELTARHANPGAIKLSHILLTFSRTLEDTAAVRDTAWQVYRKLKGGMDFQTAVTQFSRDQGSVGRGGDLGFYERERISPDLASILFAIPIDSITEPVRFPYGFHIFKVTEKKPLPPFSDLEKDLRNTYQQQRYPADYERYVRDLRKRYGVTIDSSLEDRLGASFDTTRTPADSAWDVSLPGDMKQKTLVNSTSIKMSVQGFLDKMSSSPDYRMWNLTPAKIEQAVGQLADAQALEEHARRAPERHPTFAALMQDYEDGVLLYRIEQDEIWKKLTVNDSLLRAYYDTTKEKYRWPERVNFAEIYVISDSAVKAANWLIQSGEGFLEVAKEHTMRQGYREKSGVWGFQPYGLNDLSKKASTMQVDSVTAPFRYQGGWSIMKVLEREGPRLKTFEEAGPELSSSYQELASKQREQEWVESLKRKFGVAINKDVLGEAFKKANGPGQ